MHNSIFQITNKSNNSLGTGFVIDKDDEGVFVVTCGHVVNGCDESVLVGNVNSKIIKNNYDIGLDLAILYVEGLEGEPLPIADKTILDKCRVIGFSKVLNDTKKEEINNILVKTGVEFLKPSNKKINAIKLSPPESISMGYSGSPVICEISNEVVGIVNIKVGEDTNYAISSKHLFEIYDKIPMKSVVASTESIKRKGLTTSIKEEDYLFFEKTFESNLDKSLLSFSTLPKVWVSPLLHRYEEGDDSSDKVGCKIELDELYEDSKSFLIKARHQYGLTCLSNYLIKKAWSQESPLFWLYLDAAELKPYPKEIEKHVTKKLNSIGLSIEDVDCVVLDGFSDEINDASKLINCLSDCFEASSMIVMMTLTDNPLMNEEISFSGSREFDVYHLWALPRNDIRKVVSKYNDKKYIGDENSVVDKVVSDLDVLNIPRTAINCLTILKIYEVEFDDSPVNRTEMIRRVLFLLFNVDDVPHYKIRPDLKDTEYVLGYFCELMILRDDYLFTRINFLNELKQFCVDSEIDLETDLIFDILYSNNIIVSKGSGFCFKFSYWVFYFAAHRMHHNSKFSRYILEDMRYTSYPELIEFYTGIDRRRDDALKVLIKDLRTTCNTVNDKCGLPSDFSIYDIARWTPSEESVELMHNELSDGVLGSNLPDAVKDNYADKSYDRARPLTQSIHEIFKGYSLLHLMKGVHAGSRALRNSDYSSPEIRHELLQEILIGWEQIMRVLIFLSPMLSKDGRADFDGAGFSLSSGFKKTPEERFDQLIHAIPTNVVGWYMDDLFSKKMGTLLYKHLDDETNRLLKHALNLLIIQKRPKGWNKHIEKCITNESKDSFYLYDIYTTLRNEYKYSFASNTSLSFIENLIKMSAAKHVHGMKKPGLKAINKVSDEVLPDREYQE